MRFLAALVWLLAYGGAVAEPEPTRASCEAAVARARTAMSRLPTGSMAQRFANADLVQAQSEGGNGEFDDCLEYAAKAEDEALHPHHQAKPPLPAATKPTAPAAGTTPKPGR